MLRFRLDEQGFGPCLERGRTPRPSPGRARLDEQGFGPCLERPREADGRAPRPDRGRGGGRLMRRDG